MIARHVPRNRLAPQARLLAAVYRYRLGMTGRAIAALFGIDTSVISTATPQIAALTATPQAPSPPDPSSSAPSTTCTSTPPATTSPSPARHRQPTPHQVTH